MTLFFASTRLTFAAFVSLAAIGSAAAAETPGTSASTEKAASAAPTSASSAPTAHREPKYCFLTETTGSRIAKKECRTRKEWQDLGVEVPNQIAR